MTRDINPGIEGIMQQLVLSPDNRYAAAFTTKHQVLKSHIFFIIKNIFRNNIIIYYVSDCSFEHINE